MILFVNYVPCVLDRFDYIFAHEYFAHANIYQDPADVRVRCLRKRPRVLKQSD